jgi:GTPase
VFVVFTNHPKAIPDHYVRYLLNGIREKWGFRGTPIRLRFRGRKDRRDKDPS